MKTITKKNKLLIAGLFCLLAATSSWSNYSVEYGSTDMASSDSEESEKVELTKHVFAKEEKKSTDDYDLTGYTATKTNKQLIKNKGFLVVNDKRKGVNEHNMIAFDPSKHMKKSKVYTTDGYGGFDPVDSPKNVLSKLKKNNKYIRVDIEGKHCTTGNCKSEHTFKVGENNINNIQDALNATLKLQTTDDTETSNVATKKSDKKYKSTRKNLLAQLRCQKQSADGEAKKLKKIKSMEDLMACVDKLAHNGFDHIISILEDEPYNKTIDKDLFLKQVFTNKKKGLLTRLRKLAAKKDQSDFNDNIEELESMFNEDNDNDLDLEDSEPFYNAINTLKAKAKSLHAHKEFLAENKDLEDNILKDINSTNARFKKEIQELQYDPRVPFTEKRAITAMLEENRKEYMNKKLKMATALNLDFQKHYKKVLKMTEGVESSDLNRSDYKNVTDIESDYIKISNSMNCFTKKYIRSPMCKSSQNFKNRDKALDSLSKISFRKSKSSKSKRRSRSNKEDKYSDALQARSRVNIGDYSSDLLKYSNFDKLTIDSSLKSVTDINNRKYVQYPFSFDSEQPLVNNTANNNMNGQRRNIVGSGNSYTGSRQMPYIGNNRNGNRNNGNNSSARNGNGRNNGRGNGFRQGVH